MCEMGLRRVTKGLLTGPTRSLGGVLTDPLMRIFHLVNTVVTFRTLVMRWGLRRGGLRGRPRGWRAGLRGYLSPTKVGERTGYRMVAGDGKKTALASDLPNGISPDPRIDLITLRASFPGFL